MKNRTKLIINTKYYSYSTTINTTKIYFTISKLVVVFLKEIRFKTGFEGGYCWRRSQLIRQLTPN